MPTQEKDVIACCSFCLKPNTEVKALVAGLPSSSVTAASTCAARSSATLPEGPTEPRLLPWEQTASLEAALANLPNVARAQTQVEESLLGWVRRARTLGATWAQVGDALGITRQSAWERFAAEE